MREHLKPKSSNLREYMKIIKKTVKKTIYLCKKTRCI